MESELAGYLCEVSQQIVGFSMANVRTQEIAVIAVLPEFEGKGIGRELLRLAEDVLWSTGCIKICLWTWPDETTRAIRLYERSGWTRREAKDGRLYMSKQRPISLEIPPTADTSHAGQPSYAEETAFASGAAQDDETHGHGHDADATHEDDDEEEHHHALPADFRPHESSILMTFPLIVLAILSTVGGLVGIPYAVSSIFGAGDVNVFERTLEPVIAKVGKGATVAPAAEHNSPAAHEGPATETAKAPVDTAEHGTDAPHHDPEEISTERKLAGLSVVLAIAGIAIGFGLFNSNPLRRLPQILVDKWRVDELYNGYIVDPITRLSREGLWKGFDVGFVDGIVNGIGHFVMELGNLVRGLQVGFVRSYAAIILVGAIAVLGYFIYYGLKLVG